MRTETIDFAHSGTSGNPEWIQVAGPEHEYVTIRVLNTGDDQHVFIGNTAPAFSAEGFVWNTPPAVTSGIFLRVINARENVWVRVNPNRVVSVIRGSAEVKF